MTDEGPAMEPRASRPDMPGYGLLQEDEGIGLLPWNWASSQLGQARNYWIVTAAASGGPHAVPVWGVWHRDCLYFSTGNLSKKHRNLARDPRLVVHLESGDDVVIMHGVAEQLPPQALPALVADEYEQKYQVSLGGEPVYAVRPKTAFGWREADFPASATRWQFTNGASSTQASGGGEG